MRSSSCAGSPDRGARAHGAGSVGWREQTPGVTAKSITIGGTFPLTGPAAPYAPIPLGMKAYFNYVNARKGPDRKRGVMGRQVVFKYYDDGYNPANTAQLTRRLVEEDKVFATVGQLGTEPTSRSARTSTSGRCRRCSSRPARSYWGLQYKEYPWTLGLQPDYIAEGDSRSPHQGEPKREEDRHPLPERRLRQGLPLRAPVGAR